jgi:hypothetical protein
MNRGRPEGQPRRVDDSTGPSAAQAILDALACDRSRCVCHASARRGNGLTHCAAHDDHDPSLNVTPRDGRTLVYCFARCSQRAIIEALRRRGLWSQRAAWKLRP